MADDTVNVKLSKRAYDALVGLKRPDEELDAFILRLALAARASGFFGQMRRDAEEQRQQR